MELILEHVSEHNKAWVESLSPKDIGVILDTLSLVPHMQT